MAKYIDIQKSTDGAVSIVDNKTFSVGQSVSMGLGSIELRNTKKAGLHIVRLSSNGHFKYSLRLTRDGRYRLGPNGGYRVVPPEEEKDPIKRVLREMDIPMSKLQRMSKDEVLKISTYSCDIDRAYPDGTETNRWETDGKEDFEVTHTRDMTSVNQYCSPEIHAAGTIAGATYAVEIVRHAHNQYIGKYVGDVAVWPGCDPKILANVLAPVIYGEGADAEYLQALTDFKVAQKWVAEKYEIMSHLERGDTIVVNGEEYSVLTDRMHGVLGRLASVHGIALIEDYLGEKQKSFLGALISEEVATRYVLDNYQVVAMEEGNNQFLRLALKSAEPKIDWMFLNGDFKSGAVALRELFERHTSLKNVLWMKALERQDLIASYPLFCSIKEENGVWGVCGIRDGPVEKELVEEEDAVNIYLRDSEVRKNLVNLSSPERFKGDKSVNIGGGNFFLDGGVVAVLCDGDEAYSSICSLQVILPLEEGEKKDLVLNIRQEHMSLDESETMVWGITVSRTEAGVVYEPYDNGKLYTCKGHLGGEVSAKALAEAE